jgi:hypothetical protein
VRDAAPYFAKISAAVRYTCQEAIGRSALSTISSARTGATEPPLDHPSQAPYAQAIRGPSEYVARDSEAKQVTLAAIPPVSGEQALRQGEVSALSGVLRDKALDRGGIRLLFNDIDLFGQFTGGAYVLRRKFIQENPNTARKLTEAVSRAIRWAQTTPT